MKYFFILYCTSPLGGSEDVLAYFMGATNVTNLYSTLSDLSMLVKTASTFRISQTGQHKSWVIWRSLMFMKGTK